MKTQLIFIFCLSLFSHSVNGQCCSINIEPSINTIVLPDNAAFEKCNLEGWCDSRHPKVWQMITAYRNKDLKEVSKIFDTFQYDFTSRNQLDSTDIKIIYRYGIYQKYAGSLSEARSCFEFITKSTDNKDLLHILSEIGIASNNKSIEKINRFKTEILNTLNSNMSPDDKAILMLELTELLNSSETISLFKNHIELHKKIKNTELKYNFLRRGIFYLCIGRNFENKYLETSLKEAFKRSRVKEPLSNYYRTLMQIYITKNDFAQAHEFAKKAVENNLGAFNSTEELIDLIYSSKDKKRDLVVISDYVRSILFLSYSRKELEPVKEAFAILEAELSTKVSDRIKLPHNLLITKNSFFNEDRNALLIIGNFLHNQTEDSQYLSRAISITDTYLGGGIYSWQKHRILTRTDKHYKNSIASILDLAEDAEEERKLHDEVNNQKEEIFSNYALHFSDIQSDLHVSLSEEINNLKRDSSELIAFYLNESSCFRIHISDAGINSKQLRGHKKVAEMARALPNLVNRPQALDSLTTISRQMYQLLFAGIDTIRAPRLSIIATDYLERVPFPLLRMDAEGEVARYLGEEKAISRQYSVRTMQLLRDLELSPKHHKVLGFSPNFANEVMEASQLRQAGYSLPPLLYNKEELLDLADMGPGKYLYGDKADIKRYHTDAANYSILHLATHAISSDVDGLRSRIYLLDNDGEPASLLASDIGNQTLNADLVTLSACETGSGSQNLLEGTIGLTKAFISAGARSVVASSWAVDDHATAELMEDFYIAIRAGKAPDLALQFARREYLAAHPGAHPSRWAAFEAYGGMVPPKWKKKEVWYASIWWYLGALLALLVGRAAYQKMRHA